MAINIRNVINRSNTPAILVGPGNSTFGSGWVGWAQGGESESGPNWVVPTGQMGVPGESRTNPSSFGVLTRAGMTWLWDDGRYNLLAAAPSGAATLARWTGPRDCDVKIVVDAAGVVSAEAL